MPAGDVHASRTGASVEAASGGPERLGKRQARSGSEERVHGDAAFAERASHGRVVLGERLDAHAGFARAPLGLRACRDGAREAAAYTVRS